MEKESTENDPGGVSEITPTPVPWYKIALGSIVFLGGVIATLYLVGNDSTGIGIVDDALIPTTVNWIYYGLQLAGG